MNEITKIKTISSESEIIYKEKSSVFRGFAIPVGSIEEANEHLAKLKKKYFDATHHCYAVRLSDQKFKYSDDGEPAGSAGIRILNAITHFELHNILIVVVRYFGGTKLGVGPLGKAYYYTAQKAVEAARIVVKKPYKKISFSTTYQMASQVHKILASYNVKVDKTVFDSEVKFNFYCETFFVAGLLSEISERLKGESLLDVADEDYLL